LKKEHKILEQCQENIASAQRALVDIYSGRLLTICIRYLSNPEIAKDALQDSWVDIFQNIEKFDYNIASFSTWATRITINRSLKYLRQKSPISELNLESTNAVFTIRNEGPENLAKDDLLNLVKKLPELYRIVFNLFVIDGYSHKEISKMLNISAESSRSRLSRARQMLKSQIVSLQILSTQ